MSAYVIVDIEVKDPKAYDEYRKMVGPTLQQYGARFLVRGGRSESLEGDWNPRRLVVLEFDSMERARQWYDSPEYGPAKTLRMKASNGNVVLVEGV